MSRARENARRGVLAATGVAAALLLPRPAAAVASAPDSVPMPRETHLSYAFDAFTQAVSRPIARGLDPSRLVRKLGGKPREAVNIDDQDRVLLPTTWWQPRLGYRPVGIKDMLTGPGPGSGPSPGRWTVVKSKTGGVSKGFQIKDSAGDRFAIKFDPMPFPELATSADVVVSKLYWAAGYNVPDNTIAYFRREDLDIGKDANYDYAGQKVPITPGFIDSLLSEVPRQADGRYRVVASRFLKGKPLGEWRYEGRRKDDIEDLIPHQLRRELRGLYAINAWVNHTDCSARNTLDMYVKDGGRSFVRHHLIDFSGCLGSASIAPQPLRSGHEYWADYGVTAKSTVTLALPPYVWESSVDPGITSVGFIDSQTFDAGNWRPYLQNPALDERTERDIKWGARIVAAFTDDLIRAAVESGRYSDPRATEYLVRVLEERRDKIVKRWLTPDEVAAVRRTNEE